MAVNTGTHASSVCKIRVLGMLFIVLYEHRFRGCHMDVIPDTISPLYGLFFPCLIAKINLVRWT